MGDLSLSVRRELCAVQIRQVPVHIPLHIVYAGTSQQCAQKITQIVHYFRAGHVQHHLTASDAWLASGHDQCPVRMDAEQVGVLADHLRFQPEPGLQPHCVELIHQSFKTAGQLSKILFPVAEACPVIISAAEPAIVQNQQFNTKIFSIFCDAEDLSLVKIKIRRFPCIQQYRSRS